MDPPMALSPAEQTRAARTPKARTCFVLQRTLRHALRDTAWQQTRAQRSRAAPGGPAPVEAGGVALATLWPAYGHGSAQDAVALTGMDTRWQRVWDWRGAAPPPRSRGTRCHCRLRRRAHHLAKTWLERPGALAEQTEGCDARPRRAALASPPRCGAGRGEDTGTLRGPAAAGRLADAGLARVGQSRLTAALALAGGAPTARARARRLGLAAVERWQSGRAQPQRLAAQAPPLREVLETRDQRGAPDPAPDPEGGLGARRLTPHGAPEHRLSREDADLRHGRTRSATPFHGCPEHWALALDSTGTRAVVGCPAHQPAPEAGELLAEEGEHGAGLCQLDIALGDRASPRRAPWAAPGGPLWTTDDVTLDCQHGTGTCPHGQTGPMVPGKDAQGPARAGEACPVRAQCPPAKRGHGRSLTIREDEPCQPQLRAQIKTTRGRASLRPRPAVEHARAHPVAHPGRRARDKGLRKNPFDGRRHAAVSNLQGAARSEEKRPLVS